MGIESLLICVESRRKPYQCRGKKASKQQGGDQRERVPGNS
jgi:hypothetical protein